MIYSSFGVSSEHNAAFENQIMMNEKERGRESMGFFSRLFSTNKSLEQKTDAGLNEQLPWNIQSFEEDEYIRTGLTRPITDEEKEIASVIASAIMAGDHLQSQIRVKSVIGIDEGKEAAAVIAAAIAARDYPHAAFKLVSVEEVTENTNENKEVSYA